MARLKARTHSVGLAIRGRLAKKGCPPSDRSKAKNSTPKRWCRYSMATRRIAGGREIRQASYGTLGRESRDLGPSRDPWTVGAAFATLPMLMLDPGGWIPTVFEPLTRGDDHVEEAPRR